MHSKKVNIIVALMVAMFLAAVEGTVVTTAVPTIAKDLQGFKHISLVFAAYLLTSAITTPIYGKLSDLFGRKNILSIGIIIFLAGSFLCGLSQSMYWLVVSRAIQGVGAGSIFTVTFTIVGDAFTIEERAKVQGALGTVWGIASLVGPFLGGVLIDTLSWHWIFFINIPFGILSIFLLQKNLRETFEKKKHSIDFAGIITLSTAMLLLLSVFLSAEYVNSFRTYYIILSLVLTIVLLMAFYKIERKAKEPTIPFNIFTKSSTIMNIISFLASGVLICLDVYIPIYIQNVLGFSATISGIVLAPMSIFWLLASIVLGKCFLQYGGKKVILLSNFILLLGVALLPTLSVNSSLIMIILYVSILGFGFGGAFTSLTIMIQESVDYSRRGAAVGTNSLLKALGQTIGVSVFGSIFNYSIVNYFNKEGMYHINPSTLFQSTALNNAVPIEEIKLSLTDSLHVLFFVLIAISILSLILSIIMSNIVEQVENAR
jgi:EmrB/QacA subfamily drug resistance transporter